MSSSSSTLHVRDIDDAKVVDALAKLLAVEGFEPFEDGPRTNEVDVRRFLVVREKGWVSIAGQDGEMLDDAAKGMSKRLRAPVLTIFTWDGEAVVLARRFEGGAEKGSFELPRQAERDEQRRARVRCAALDPWLDARARKKLGGWLVLDDGPDEDEDEDDDVFVSEDESLAAIGGALGLEHVALDAYDEDIEGARMLAFRPTADRRARAAAVAEEQRPKFKGRSPILPPREGAFGEAYRDAYSLADYAARGYAVGWIGFDAPPRTLASTMLAIAKPLVEGLFLGDAWKHCKATLQTKHVVDLCDSATPDRKKPNLWMSLPGRAKPSEPRGLAPVPGVIGWSVPRPASDAERSELAALMHEAMLRALATDSCVGACVVGAGRGRAREWSALPYEVIAGTDAGGLRPEWVRTHARSPGWRVLVPAAAASRLPKKTPSGIRLHRGPAGVLVAVDVLDPFAHLHQDAEPLERYLLDVIGSPRELRALLG